MSLSLTGKSTANPEELNTAVHIGSSTEPSAKGLLQQQASGDIWRVNSELT